jgi:large subunit ribosomal protein L1
MPKHGKRYRNVADKLNRESLYEPTDAMRLVKECANTKFNETIEVHCRLGINPRNSDQQVRGTTSLPHGTGKTPNVAVVAQGDFARAAEEGGADRVGGQELIEDIDKGWMDFDVLVAEQGMMRMLGRLGRKLTTRMPSPRSGTVAASAEDMRRIVEELKRGKIEYRADRQGVLHSIIGKSSFSEDQLRENFSALMDAVLRAKPASAKGQYLKSVTVTSTMGPGIKMDPAKVTTLVRG